MSTAAAPGLPLPLDRSVRPRLARGIVERPRLLAALDDPTSTLTLVSAAAGSGKTTLLLLWTAARTDEVPIAWVTARREDDDHTFWRVATDAVAQACGREPGGEDSPAALLRTFAELDRPLTLIVDDFDLISSPIVLEFFDRLAEWAPEKLRIVLASRHDPALQLHRLALSGRMREIRARDLAFSLDETTHFFAEAGLEHELGPQWVRALHQRTGGWAAALRFAAISLRGCDDAEAFVLALARTDQAVSDYLVREVLAAQTPELRDFLLRTSLCARIDGDLADAVTGGCDGARTLESLEHANVFLELQEDGQSYAYHGLFAALLQACAQRELGDEVAAVHAAAAGRLASAGRFLEALRHALASEDAAHSAELVATLWVDLISAGELRLVGDVLDCIGADAVLAEPHLCVLAAWKRLCDGDLSEADSWLEAADRHGANSERNLAIGRAMVGLMRAKLVGDPVGLDAAVATLTRPEALALRDGAARRAFVFNGRGVLALWKGELDVAESALEAGLVAAHHVRLRKVEADTTATLAVVCALRGELKRAARLVSGMAGESAGGHVALAICELQWDDAAEASRHAARAHHLAEAAGDRVTGLLAQTVSALAGASGEAGANDARLDLSALAADGAEALPLLAPTLAVLRARLALSAGDVAGASELLALQADSPQRTTGLVRIALASGDVDGARSQLDALLEESHNVPLPLLVEAKVLRAVTAEVCGEEDQSCVWLESAFDTAEAEAIRRPFLDVGPVMAAILRRTIRRGSSHRWLAGSLLAVLEGHEAPQGHRARELLDPLSHRETIILRYLPTMMSNQEIAGELFVSVNTIKTHLKSIYRKLGASDRRAAVRLARELRLIG